MRGCQQPHSRQEHPHDRRGNEPVAPAHDRRQADCAITPKTRLHHICATKNSNDPARAGRAIGIALIILTSSSKQFRLGLGRGSRSPQGSVRPMRLKGRRNTYHVEVAKCAIFATPSSLKSHAGRNLKSPFSSAKLADTDLKRLRERFAQIRSGETDSPGWCQRHERPWTPRQHRSLFCLLGRSTRHWPLGQYLCSIQRLYGGLIARVNGGLSQK